MKNKAFPDQTCFKILQPTLVSAQLLIHTSYGYSLPNLELFPYLKLGLMILHSIIGKSFTIIVLEMDPNRGRFTQFYTGYR